MEAVAFEPQAYLVPDRPHDGSPPDSQGLLAPISDIHIVKFDVAKQIFASSHSHAFGGPNIPPIAA